jgi:5'-nucleotidase / UDP-sugar diphosphatase
MKALSMQRQSRMPMRVARCTTSLCIALLTLNVLHAGTASERTISILFTHDLHSHVLPLNVVGVDNVTRESGGFARLAGAITLERARHPASTIVVDAGDYSMGTLFHTLVMDRAVELRLLGMMGYDAGTFGNHDFDFRLDGIERSLAVARTSGDRVIPLLLSNITIPPGTRAGDSLRAAFEAYGVRDHMILERDGLRIGLFALMGEDAAKDCPFIGPASFRRPAPDAERMVTFLREQERVDLVVCLSHGGTVPDRSYSEDERLAAKVPGIDVIVSGHTHRAFAAPLHVGNTLIVSAGSNCSTLGVLDLNVTGHTVAVRDYRLVPLDLSIAKDVEISARAAGFVQDIDTLYLRQFGFTYGQQLAWSPFPFETIAYGYANPGELRIGNLITDAFAAAVKRAEGDRSRPVDVVIEPLGMIRNSFVPGAITVDDAFQVLSLGRGPDGQPGYPLVASWVTGEDLLTILEVGPTLASVKSDVHLQFKGVRFVFNPHRLPLNRITHAELVDDDGRIRPIVPDSLYRICVNLYTAMMIGSLADLSYGLVHAQPRLADGSPVRDLRDVMIDADTLRPGIQEVKEWIALVSFLRSFPVDSTRGSPVIPTRYSETRGWYQAEDSFAPGALFSSPNRFALRVVGGLIVLSGLFVLTGHVLRKQKV